MATRSALSVTTRPRCRRGLCVVDALIESGLRERVRVIAAGKLVTSARAAWALSAGADFVNTARGFM
ncbi:MAG: hypothetical protein K8F56_07525, partial [Rhodocyclaceae bacterium]|nr:hypothetical protein [Rhodocyclaceae bacterium]